MKIVIAAPLYPPETGMIATYTKKLAENLCKNQEITVVAYANNLEKSSKIKFFSINKKESLPLRFLKYAISLRRASRGADVIIAQNAVASGLPAIIVQFLTKIPVFINFMEDEAWKSAKRLRLSKKNIKEFLKTPEGGFKIRLVMRLQKFVLHRAKMVIMPSKYLADIAIEAYDLPEKKVFVNYTPPENREIFPFHGKVNPAQILAIGYKTEKNGISNVIRAIDALKKNFEGMQLLVAGENQVNGKPEALIGKIKMPNGVISLGHLSRAENWRLIENSQICLLNSLDEFFVNNALKCFTLGTPIMAEDSPIAREIIDNGKTGFLINIKDINKITEVITRLIEGHDLRQYIAETGKSALSKKFSWEVHVHKLTTLLKNNLN